MFIKCSFKINRQNCELREIEVCFLLVFSISVIFLLNKSICTGMECCEIHFGKYGNSSRDLIRCKQKRKKSTLPLMQSTSLNKSKLNVSMH